MFLIPGFDGVILSHEWQEALWAKFVEDMKTGPKEPRSTVLTEAEEAVIVAFRRHTLLPLDDCLYALQAFDPASDTISAAPVPSTARHLTSA